MTSLLAIDWGTTSARAYRMDASGAVIDERSAPLGVTQVQGGHFDEALDRLWATGARPACRGSPAA